MLFSTCCNDQKSNFSLSIQKVRVIDRKTRHNTIFLTFVINFNMFFIFNYATLNIIYFFRKCITPSGTNLYVFLRDFFMLFELACAVIASWHNLSNTCFLANFSVTDWTVIYFFFGLFLVLGAIVEQECCNWTQATRIFFT